MNETYYNINVSPPEKQRVDMSKCLPETKSKYYLDRFAVISDDPEVKQNAQTFF